MLADADGDDRIAVMGQFPQFMDRMLLQDAVIRFVVMERIGFFPLCALLVPG